MGSLTANPCVRLLLVLLVLLMSGDYHRLAAPAIQVAHAVAMAVAWGLLLPVGVLLARHTKAVGKQVRRRL